MSEKFLNLTNFWYEFVSCDHHKDRDCHFYVNQVWSYGEKPYYRIEHYGYMAELPKELEDKRFTDYASAFKTLEEWLYLEYLEIKIFYENYTPDESIDYNWKGVKEVLEKYKDIIK